MSPRMHELVREFRHRVDLATDEQVARNLMRVYGLMARAFAVGFVAGALALLWWVG